jgi:hypothetical protein
MPSLIILALCAGASAASETPAGEAAAAPAAEAPPEQGGHHEEEKKWSASLSAYLYIVPDEDDYVQPTATLDHGRLHLEARYNYEAQDTGSLWAGLNFSGGETVTWELTPMLGGVFGQTQGVAPGYRGSVGWWKLELYSEGEWLIDTERASDSFFYNWSELTIAPVEWVRLGLVTQHTRAYETDRDVQRGILTEFFFKAVNFRTILFNIEGSTPLVVFAVGLSF